MLRPMGMKRPLLLATIALAASACTGDPHNAAPSSQATPVTTAPAAATSVPPEFASARGRPNAVVAVQAKRVVIPHSACDLTGVILRARDGQRGGVRVPPTTINTYNNTDRISVEIDSHTSDVTFEQDRPAIGY